MNDFMEGIKAEIGENFEGSFEDLQDKIQSFQHQNNREGLKDFRGLSSEQMHRILYFPFESPDFVSFNLKPHLPNAPYWILMQSLLDEFELGPIKATAKGNLNVKLCKKIWIRYLENTEPNEWVRKMGVRTEDQFQDLHCLRIILELAGCMKKRKGVFSLTQKALKILKGSGIAGLFHILFRTSCEKFNWSYRDYQSEFGVIQHSFLFSLFLLHEADYAYQPVPNYVNAMITAFPMLLSEAEQDCPYYQSPLECVEGAYMSRFMEFFAWGFGFVELKRAPFMSKDIPNQARKIDTLYELVQFK